METGGGGDKGGLCGVRNTSGSSCGGQLKCADNDCWSYDDAIAFGGMVFVLTRREYVVEDDTTANDDDNGRDARAASCTRV